MKILGNKAGIYGMLGGQVVDVKETGHALDKDVLDFIYALKTGALLESSMMIGATLADADEESIALIEKVASKVGLAFSGFRMIYWMLQVQQKCLANQSTVMRRTRRPHM